MARALMFGYWTVERGKPVAVFGYRDDRGRREWRRIKATPYFYAPCGWSTDCIPDVLGRKVKLVETALPSDVPVARSKYPWTDEADVPFALRVAVDHGLGYWDEPGDDIVRPRVLYFDIEVWSPKGEMPDPENPKWPVKSVQFLDSYSGVVSVKVAPGEPSREDEEELARFFEAAIEHFDPDFLAGWYVLDFDEPYLRNRLGVKINRPVIDLLELYHRYVDRYGSATLKSVAARLGFEYENLQTRIAEASDAEIEQYAANDVKALKLIDDHYGLIDTVERLRMVSDALGGSVRPSEFIDAKLLRIRDRPLPTKGTLRWDEEVKGAVVLDPPVGIFEGVAIFDVASMYPSIILSRKVGESWYVPRLVSYFKDARERYRRMRREAERRGDPAAERIARLEWAAKTLANAVYGQLGYAKSRLFNPTFANEVTSVGREIITSMKEFVESKGYRVLYGDTDSVMVQVPFDEAKKLEVAINSFLADRFGAGISVKWEKYLERMMFFGVKKRYAGLLTWKEGVETRKLYIAGLESKRSDTPEFTKRIQAEVVRMILEGRSEDAKRLLRESWEAFPSMPLKEVGRPKGVDLTRNYKQKFLWKEAAERAARLGISGPRSGKYYLYHTVDGGAIALPEDYDWEMGWPFKIEIDWEKQREKGFEQPLRHILKLLEVDIKWLRTGRVQAKLDWFG